MVSTAPEIQVCSLAPSGADALNSPARHEAPFPYSVPRASLPTRFGLRLRSLRHAKGMTQLEVAVSFGIDRTFLSDLERGRKSASLPFIEVFALGFGISISELLAGL